MHTLKATLVLTALLATGMLMAQEPATPSNQDTQLSAQNAPQNEGHGRHAMNPNKQARHLAKELSLTKDQEAQIEPILADRDQQIQSLFADSNLAPQDRREKMRAIQQDSKGKIEAVLNDSQKQQFEQMLANRRAHHKGAPAGQSQPGQTS
jgi:Spy/CpxP family protein refolding chaperone